MRNTRKMRKSRKIRKMKVMKKNEENDGIIETYEELLHIQCLRIVCCKKCNQFMCQSHAYIFQHDEDEYRCLRSNSLL